MNAGKLLMIGGVVMAILASAGAGSLAWSLSRAHCRIDLSLFLNPDPGRDESRLRVRLALLPAPEADAADSAGIVPGGSRLRVQFDLAGSEGAPPAPERFAPVEGGVTYGPPAGILGEGRSQ